MNSAVRAVVRFGRYLGCKVYFIKEGYQVIGYSIETLFIFKYFWTNDFIFSTYKQFLLSQLYKTEMLFFPAHTLAGFELGFSVHEADHTYIGMSTESRHQGFYCMHAFVFLINFDKVDRLFAKKSRSRS
jgi:hypothetical protein